MPNVLDSIIDEIVAKRRKVNNPCEVCGQDTAVRHRCPYCSKMCCSTCKGQRGTATKSWRHCRGCR